MKSVDQVFSNAYRKYFDQVAYQVFKRVKCYDTAQDITQEVFILYYKKISSGIDITDPCAWLFSTVWYHMLNHNRLSWQTKIDDQNFQINDIVQPDHDFKLPNESYSICQDIVRTSLNEPQRKMLVLVGLENNTYSAVGQQIGLSDHQVTRQYNKVRRILLYNLRKNGFNSPRELL